MRAPPLPQVQARVASAPEAMWDPAEQRRSNALIDGRQDNMVRFKPGVQALMLLFSDQAGRRVFKFPYWDYFAAQMEPLLEEVGVMQQAGVHGAGTV